MNLPCKEQSACVQGSPKQSVRTGQSEENCCELISTNMVDQIRADDCQFMDTVQIPTSTRI